MKLDCILTATNNNKLYADFIPSFIKHWKHLVPSADVKIIFIDEKIPDEYIQYKENIILFKPEGEQLKMNTAFIAQFIRLLYPALLPYTGGVLITDMDMLPMNGSYYIDNITNIPDNKFVYLRNVLFEYKEIAMCYNVACPPVWSDIFKIKTIEDICTQMQEIYKNIEYDGNHGGSGWTTDQKEFFKRVMNWNQKTKNFVFLNDNKTGFLRLDRGRFAIDQNLIRVIKSKQISDYHALRPYSEYKEMNDIITKIVCDEI
jgi:hypothetical protein